LLSLCAIRVNTKQEEAEKQLVKQFLTGSSEIHKGVAPMKFIVTGKNTNVSEAMMEKAQKKVGRLDKFFRPDAEATLKFDVEKGRNIFEATIKAKGMFIRAEETTTDMYASIDLVIEKLERQIRKYKTKLGKRIHQEAMIPENFDIDETVEEDDELQIVRSKKFPLKPMSVEEAVLQMNLLGHNFFVFANAEDEQINVVYKRKGAGYGLIEPDM